MPYCCKNCFLDDYLRQYIVENGTLGACTYCGSTQVSTIDPQELRDLFEPVTSLYTAMEEFMWVEELKEYEGRFIWEVLTEEWEVFDDPDIGHGIIEEMFAVCSPSDPAPLFLSSWVENEDEYTGHSDDRSVSQIKKWNDFKRELISENRFFLKKQLDLNLFEELLCLFTSDYDTDSCFFRARLSAKDKKIPPAQMGAPPKHKSIDGRANPRGIPYLYVASDSNTAISEIRPDLHEFVTVAEFTPNTSLRVVDLTRSFVGSPFPWGHNLGFVLTYWTFLSSLGNDLSMPIDRKNAALEYLPTQYLCELIKHVGYDGALYKSHVGEGYNIALFEESKVTCLDTTLHKVESITITANRT